MAAKKKAESAKKGTEEVGAVWDIPSGSIVQRPDGMVVSVGHGGHVLDMPGTYICGDDEVTAE